MVNTTHFSGNVDVVDADAATTGLMLANVLVTATAQEINSIADMTGRDVPVTTATLTLTAANTNQNLVLNRAAGSTIVLPAATASGSVFRFIVQTSVTSNSYIVKVANSTDVMTGYGIESAGAGASMFATTSSSDTVTMNGTTTGGLAGSQIVIRDIAAGFFQVEVYANGSGTLATPFSATV